MKQKDKIILKNKGLIAVPEKIVDDRDNVTNLLLFNTEITSQELLAKQKKIDGEKRQMISGEIFTVADLNEDYRKYMSEIEKNYEPKFTLFLERFGTLCNWTEEQKKKFRKPMITAITIIELFYNRFPEGTIKYMRKKNKYVKFKFFIRRTKNYKFFNEEGIRRLERMIDEVNILMPTCKGYYELRKKMFELFKVPYQIDLFADLL
jgi:hypothetical protein